MRNLGGNKVSTVDVLQDTPTIFSESPYYYALFSITPESGYQLPRLQAMTIYALNIPTNAIVVEESTRIRLHTGDCVQAHHTSPQVSVEAGSRCSFLIAGVLESQLPKELSIVKACDIKKVSKPWGHELWISGEHSEYALKQVYIRAPHKTSLQYHNLKHETIVLFSGTARLHHRQDEQMSHENLETNDVISTPLSPVTVAHIVPPVLHRFEACTDLTLYEASTPHLHDVIRVSDDSNRPDGRIESEHTNPTSIVTVESETTI